jgi:predicted DNA-binding transcriptional regulator AlpA
VTDRSLRLVAAPLVPPPDRGRLLTAPEVAQRLGRTPDWVKRCVPHKVRLGRRTVRWYERDVEAWLEQQREAS